MKMYIENLKIVRFRNIDNLNIILNKEANFFIGKNGTGKTNIIEALYFLSSMKSFRFVKDVYLIKNGEKDFYISALCYDKEYENHEVGFLLGDVKRRKYKIEGKEIVKFIDYYNKINAIVFSPSDTDIIDGAPELLRKYIDSVISKTDKNYLILLTEFKKCIQSRNSIFKKYKDEKKIIKYNDEIAVWDEMFSKLSYEIIKIRNNFLDIFNNYIKESYEYISSDTLSIIIKYTSTVHYENAEAILKDMKESFVKDCKFGFSTLGPHRDRYDILNENGIFFSKTCSQGQKRTAAISLKNSEKDYIENNSGNKSILLIDDIFSELDKERQKKMLSLLNKGNQLVFTMTDINRDVLSLYKDYLLYSVENGCVVKAI
jgi:DNA replication and repair protein RecF